LTSLEAWKASTLTRKQGKSGSFTDYSPGESAAPAVPPLRKRKTNVTRV
jgi:hypothetical protein